MFLELADVLLRAFDLVGRQRTKDSVHSFDFRYAMAKHHDVLSGLEREANGLIQTIPGQNGAHVEIVSHDETIETKFVA